MKFIDEKGRLFGKINLIDLLVIVLLLAVVCAVLWKTVGKRASEAANTQSLRASYTVRCEEICDFAQTQVGEKLLNNAVFLDAEITACKAEPVDAEKPDGLQTLYITIDAAAATANNVYKVASQEIRAGYEYNVKTPLFELAGVICELEVRNG